MKLIERAQYLQRLIDVIGTPDIKVITGIRRSGKSKLMEALKSYIEKNIVNCNIIHINFNLPDTEQLKTHTTLYEYINSLYIDGAQNFVLIDEIQMCTDFEKAVNWIHSQEKYDIFITGSNAFLLSSDLATLFTGRTLEFHVFPFSYSEYLTYYELENSPANFDKYIFEGGMAGSYVYRNDNDKYNYISSVFDTLVIRDIKQKYNIRKPLLLNKLSDYMMDNIGNLASVRSLAKSLSISEDSITNKTVNSYLEYLCNAFAFYRIKRYDIRGKKYLSSSEKYYLSDHSFRYAKLGTKNMDYGRVIENIVAIELKRRGYELYVGVLYHKEIDFVAVRRNEKVYIQVADNISEDETFNREVSPLLSIKDAYPRILLARTGHAEYQYEGIHIIDLGKWLTEYSPKME